MTWAKWKVGDFKPDFSNMARSLNLDPFVYYENFSGKITGLGASILLGYSREWLWGICYVRLFKIAREKFDDTVRRLEAFRESC